MKIEIPKEHAPLYHLLRHWRNDRAKQAALPHYALFDNRQMLEMARLSTRRAACPAFNSGRATFRLTLP